MESLRSYRQLAYAVINQARKDLFTRVSEKIKDPNIRRAIQRNRKDAKQFFFSPQSKEDLDFWCSLTELNKETLIRTIGEKFKVYAPTQDLEVEKNHHNSVKTHCPQGHAYEGENLYWYGTRRRCKACRRMTNRNYKVRVKATSLEERES